ncbi:MAG: hypothetical protein ACUVXH_04610 [Anaerolineae bacterium]
MAVQCPFRQQDALTGVVYCSQAATDSVTSFLTGSNAHDTCGDCPVPALRKACACRWLELMTVMEPRPDGHHVVEVKMYCRNDDVRLETLEECTAARCKAFQPRT